MTSRLPAESGLKQPAFDRRGCGGTSQARTCLMNLLDALRGRRIGLVVIDATGGLERALAGSLLRHNLPVAGWQWSIRASYFNKLCSDYDG